jgi:hypothetical protein
MSTQAAPQRAKSIEPSPEDRSRLSRLYEEIAGRQAELSLILARVFEWDRRSSELFACALPADFPLAAIAENKELRSLISPKRINAKEEDGGGFTSPMIIITNVSTGDIGVEDASTGTCYPLDHSE